MQQLLQLHLYHYTVFSSTDDPRKNVVVMTDVFSAVDSEPTISKLCSGILSSCVELVLAPGM